MAEVRFELGLDGCGGFGQQGDRTVGGYCSQGQCDVQGWKEPTLAFPVQ